MTKILVLALVLLAITLGSWFLLGPKPQEKNAPHYAVRVVTIRQYSRDEMVSIANQGDKPVDISGWTLWAHRPNKTIGIAYRFPQDCVLKSQQMIRVHSGPEALGHSSTKCQGKTPDLFWTLRYVWCDSNGDSAYLYDAKGNLANRFEYGAGWHLSAVVPCAPGG